MATKTKAASKPAPKKKAPAKKSPPNPVEIESITVSARQDGATLVINGREYTLTVQQFLGLRNDIGAQAAGLVH
jgi:hypothetical protein